MNKEYKILDYACGTKETGSEYPQVQEMSANYDYDAINSVYSLAQFYETLPKFNPNLDSFILHNKAKPTDFISNSLISTGFLISEKVKILLSEYNLPKHIFYPVNIIHKGNNLENYYLLLMVNDYIKYVDYSKSSFFLYKNFSLNAGSIEINSEQDFLEKNMGLQMNDPTLRIWADKIKFINTFPSDIDFFSLSKFNANTFISKELSEEILNKKVTGSEIKIQKII